MSCISALYIYTNPPPMGYGSPAPKVAESVLRAYEYNLNHQDNRERNIDNYSVNTPYWLGNSASFPFDKTHGNFHAGEAHRMFKQLLIDNYENITLAVKQTMNTLMMTNSDALTKGRQTWCPFSRQSLPSAMAYIKMSQFFKDNTGVRATNCLEWIKAFCECLNKKELVARVSVDYLEQRTRIDKSTRQKIRTSITKRRYTIKKITGNEECYRFMMDIARSFCS